MTLRVTGLTGTRVVVFGMARSGVGAARLAVAAGAASVVCTDQRPDAPKVEGTRAVYGRHDANDLLQADLVILSPGVPPTLPLLEQAQAAGVKVRSELEVAAGVLAAAGVPVLAVTGTNGKSSTVWLLHQVLEQAGLDSWVGGNLGEPVSTLSEAIVEGRTPPDVAVVEVSSYQLETTSSFRPAGAALLNITPDHLARHGTMAHYAEAKLRLFAHQEADDLAVLPHAGAMSLSTPGSARVLRLGTHPGVVLTPTHLDFGPGGPRVATSDFPLPGTHNRANLAAALLLARHVGVDPQKVRLDTLRPLPHRMELVATDALGRQWINDSKATNVDAALVGIEATAYPTVFLLGGQGKAGATYQDLAPALRSRSRRVICFGSTGPTIAAQLRAAGLAPDCVPSLPDAISSARTVAAPGDTILLSPACASFDAYPDFEARGRHFTDLARAPASLPSEPAP